MRPFALSVQPFRKISRLAVARQRGCRHFSGIGFCVARTAVCVFCYGCPTDRFRPGKCAMPNLFEHCHGEKSTLNHSPGFVLKRLKKGEKHVNIFRKKCGCVTTSLSMLCNTYCLALQKRRFCTVKPYVLHRKTYGFATPNRLYHFLTELFLQNKGGFLLFPKHFFRLSKALFGAFKIISSGFPRH